LVHGWNYEALSLAVNNFQPKFTLEALVKQDWMDRIQTIKRAVDACRQYPIYKNSLLYPTTPVWLAEFTQKTLDRKDSKEETKS
jgi:hypothetical protein